MPAYRHEQMRNRSLESREFNHKIFGDKQKRYRAASPSNCTFMVRHH